MESTASAAILLILWQAVEEWLNKLLLEDVVYEKNDFTFDMLQTLHESHQNEMKSKGQLNNYLQQAIEAIKSDGKLFKTPILFV